MWGVVRVAVCHAGGTVATMRGFVWRALHRKEGVRVGVYFDWLGSTLTRTYVRTYARGSMRGCVGAWVRGWVRAFACLLSWSLLRVSFGGGAARTP